MREFRRRAQATWEGGLRGGRGRIGSASGVLRETPYSFVTRFDDVPGTNPEELIAAAHAACYSMALSGYLESKGFTPESIETQAECRMALQPEGPPQILGIKLNVRGRVPNMDTATFAQMAKEGDAVCPVSNLLRSGLQIEIEATLA